MICIPITGLDMNQALADLDKAAELADLFELRIDMIKDADIPALLSAATKPCIVTNRTKLEGGEYRGDDASRIQRLRDAIDAGADYVDVEVSTPRELLQSIIEGERKNTQVIVSYHDFTKTPDRLEGLYEIMRELPGDNILKIVTYAQDLNDNLQMFRLVERARKEGQKFIGLCMGEKGEISRILSTLLGGYLTFGSLDRGKESAPGQITASRLREVYRIGALAEPVELYGVLGNPVSKSMGPWIHNRAFKETNRSAIYVPLLSDNAEKFVEGFKDRIQGLSVTMPFKENMVPLVSAMEDAAKPTGALNTLYKKDDQWIGANTDGVGALQALEKLTDVSGKRILIIGAGGAAKAIGHEAVRRGASVTVTFNANQERAEKLAKELGGKAIPIRAALNDATDILINCSPVGMTPDVETSPVSARKLNDKVIVFDTVYNPLETRLLRDAKEAGCKTVSGVEMFLNQAAAQFELWTGESAPVEAMREALMDQLQDKTP